MLIRSWLVVASMVLLLLMLGCGAAVRRAPIDSVPDDVDPQTRIDMLEELARDYPDDAYLFFELANVYYDEAMPTDARRNYEKVLRLDPKMNRARVNLATLLAESGEPDSAKVLLEEAIKIDPKDAKAYNNLGMVYYAEMAVDKAVKHFTKAIELDPENVEAHYNLGLAFAESGLLLEAIREWRLILDISPESDTGQRARLSLERVQRDLKK